MTPGLSVSLQRLVTAGVDEGGARGLLFWISDISERQAGRFHIATGRVVFRSLMTRRPLRTSPRPRSFWAGPISTVT